MSYLNNSQAIIFVVDSTNREKLSEAKDLLNRYLNHDHLRRAALLFVANKQESSESIAIEDLKMYFELDAATNASMRNRSWQIIGVSSLTGAGLTESLDWLASLF